MHCLKAKIKQIPRKTEQKEKENMNAIEALDELQRKARHDDKLREQFIKTRDAEDSLCRNEAQYEWWRREFAGTYR